MSFVLYLLFSSIIFLNTAFDYQIELDNTVIWSFTLKVSCSACTEISWFQLSIVM